MPHDSNGTRVEVGQVVTMRFIVARVDQGVDYCNVTLNALTTKRAAGFHNIGALPTVCCNASLMTIEALTDAEGKEG